MKIFLIVSKNGVSLIKNDVNTITEETILIFICEYLSSFIDIGVLNDYYYSCTTRVIIQKPESAWGEYRDGFYIIESDKEEYESVKEYSFDFNKYCNGVKTSDYLSVKCSPKGDILSVGYKNSGLDWNKVPVVNKKINESVNDFIKNAISIEYEIIDYKIQSISLTDKNTDMLISISCEILLSKNDNDFPILCRFYLVPFMQE